MRSHKHRTSQKRRLQKMLFLFMMMNACRQSMTELQKRLVWVRKHSSVPFLPFHLPALLRHNCSHFRLPGCHSLTIPSISFGPWRVGNTCLAKPSLSTTRNEVVLKFCKSTHLGRCHLFGFSLILQSQIMASPQFLMLVVWDPQLTILCFIHRLETHVGKVDKPLNDARLSARSPLKSNLKTSTIA